MPEELTGQAKLFDALTTKGTAFTRDERRKYSLSGTASARREKTIKKGPHMLERVLHAP